jgi:hypothetical protein
MGLNFELAFDVELAPTTLNPLELDGRFFAIVLAIKEFI